MTPFLSARSLALAGGATALALLLAQPAQAHGIAQGGTAAGFFHPNSGVDHLLLLVSVGAAGAVISPQLLLWALAGAIGGGVFGALLGACAALVAASVAVHAMLHGLEAPAGGSAALWWLGALSGSVLVSGGSLLLLRRLPVAWTRGVALLLALGGGMVALGPIGLLVR